MSLNHSDARLDFLVIIYALLHGKEQIAPEGYFQKKKKVKKQSDWPCFSAGDTKDKPVTTASAPPGAGGIPIVTSVHGPLTGHL